MTGDQQPAARGETSLADLVRHVGARTGPVRLAPLRGAACGIVGARLVAAHEGTPALFLTPDSKRADVLLEDLRTALGEPPAEEGGRVRAFPRHDTPPYDRFSPQPFVTAQRMDVLHRLLAFADDPVGPAPVIVTPWTALAWRVPSPDTVRAHTHAIVVGQELDRDGLVADLVRAGYTRQSLVEERGELAVRGGILDFFPPHRARPLRVELLGDEIESIREFDPASQRSESGLELAVATPPRELLFERELVIERSEALRALAHEQGHDAENVDALIDTLLRGNAPPGVEALGALLQPELEPLFSFWPEGSLVVIDQSIPGRERLLHHLEEAHANYEAALEGGRLAQPPSALMLSSEEIEHELRRRRPVALESLDVAAEEEGPAAHGHRYAVRGAPDDELASRMLRARTTGDGLAPLADQLREWREEGLRVVAACPALSGAERLARLLRDHDLDLTPQRKPAPITGERRSGSIELRVASLSSGAVIPSDRLVVVTEEEIFGRRERRRRRATLREGAAVDALAQLDPGDALVHAEHGIGVYRGLVELQLGGFEGEFLRLEYEGGDRLFLPVHRLNLVQRYVGADGQSLRLDRLGGLTWEKAKGQVRRSVRRLARELLEVHAARELAQGHAFPSRDSLLREFEAAFPFEETPDQMAAIEDVLGDLAEPRPMDRLVCGDVGYGKTEVAARGAFRAAMDGKQVAVLVPTTVLCQQHFETFKARFADHPIRVEYLSRFRTPAQSKRVLEGLANGDVDIVIGTHRLLQKSVQFRDLGLLVVDEEHRFGVAHKERIKQLKKSVDVLTLTATPIPRTLQQTFTGLRDLSIIETPPADRLAIRTQVCRFDESLIREAILREVRRGGQVFFLHNRVRSIDSVLEILERIVPEVSVLVAHGQMRERELEDRMLAFLRGEADVLLCTTIIESGLDIPRANTLIVDRADALGLAQLYQIRGRVGRSRHRAYAYLMIKGEAALSSDARRRLEAIQDLSELGSGFRLANMDLEIRGAGNLLGPEQSGHMVTVGYETYMELLQETVEELRGTPHEAPLEPEIKIPVAARLPEEYVPEVHQRLVLYKRLASAPDEAEVDRVRDELLDRYGPLAPETESLIDLIRVKLLAQRARVPTIEHRGGALYFTNAAGSCLDPARLVDLLNEPDSAVTLTSDQRIRVETPDPTSAAVFERARWLLGELLPRA